MPGIHLVGSLEYGKNRSSTVQCVKFLPVSQKNNNYSENSRNLRPRPSARCGFGVTAKVFGTANAREWAGGSRGKRFVALVGRCGSLVICLIETRCIRTAERSPTF